ncbi:hypothetical protein TIFTF001_016774 [Ficus carica]|uniref:Uncharacterized protein n=1 Tax=Ficus carica TaxID=3494 RepID=A0AA88A6W7_FICCA|nr:hypothetical protein TIFTF001_016774 [Ficus carica]
MPQYLLSLKSFPLADLQYQIIVAVAAAATTAVAVGSLPENTRNHGGGFEPRRQHLRSPPTPSDLAVIRDFAGAQRERRFRAPSAVRIFVAAGLKLLRLLESRNRGGFFAGDVDHDLAATTGWFRSASRARPRTTAGIATQPPPASPARRLLSGDGLYVVFFKFFFYYYYFKGNFEWVWVRHMG